MFFQQWTGINAILYYAPSIFVSDVSILSLGNSSDGLEALTSLQQDLGLSSNTTSLLATGVVGIVMFLATIPAILYIDKLGRRPVLAGGAVAMGACHIIIASESNLPIQTPEELNRTVTNGFLLQSSSPRMRISGQPTRLPGGVPLQWFGCSLPISVGPGAPARGYYWPKYGLSPLVHMGLPSAHRQTG